MNDARRGRSRPLCRWALSLGGWLIAGLLTVQAQESAGLREVPFAQLSDRSLTALGQAALTIRGAEWKHAETPNFIYHYFQSFIVAPVSVEAEFYYRVIAKELEKDTAQWERKCHIFVFERDADWAEFQKRGSLEQWTGGIHAGGSLFIQRNPEVRFKGNTLGHEITHLVIDRFFGSGVPLWLNEGYAEFSASKWYASFQRARNYAAHPTAHSVPAQLLRPVAELAARVTYPEDVVQVQVFYGQAEKLVRFLSATDKRGFGVFFEALAHGSRFETAVGKGFGARFINLEALEREFRNYASSDHGALTSN